MARGNLGDWVISTHKNDKYEYVDFDYSKSDFKIVLEAVNNLWEVGIATADTGYISLPYFIRHLLEIWHKNPITYAEQHIGSIKVHDNLKLTILNIIYTTVNDSSVDLRRFNDCIKITWNNYSIILTNSDILFIQEVVPPTNQFFRFQTSVSELINYLLIVADDIEP